MGKGNKRITAVTLIALLIGVTIVSVGDYAGMREDNLLPLIGMFIIFSAFVYVMIELIKVKLHNSKILPIVDKLIEDNIYQEAKEYIEEELAKALFDSTIYLLTSRLINLELKNSNIYNARELTENFYQKDYRIDFFYYQSVIALYYNNLDDAKLYYEKLLKRVRKNKRSQERLQILDFLINNSGNGKNLNSEYPFLNDMIRDKTK